MARGDEGRGDEQAGEVVVGGVRLADAVEELRADDAAAARRADRARCRA
jgi:hypothetical protein